MIEADISQAEDRIEEAQKTAVLDTEKAARQEIVVAAALPPAPQRERIVTDSFLPVLDTGKFDQMWRIAKVMAAGWFLADSICKEKNANGDMVFLPETVVEARAFKIINFAVINNVDPFSAAECASFVYGRLCWEGKFIAALIESKLKIRLRYEWNDKVGDAMGITIFGQYPDEDFVRSVEGTVAQWKTTHSGSPWKNQPSKQLAYRGAREWARLHAPGIMTGVITPDEVEFLVEQQDRRPRLAAPTPGARALERLQKARTDTGDEGGFNQEHVANGVAEATAPAKETKAPAPAAEVSGDAQEGRTVTDASQGADGGDVVDEDAEAARLNRAASGEASAPIEDQKAKPARAPKTDKPAPAAKVVEIMPKDAAEYEAYLDAWLDAPMPRAEIIRRWTDEKKLRADLAIDLDTVMRLREKVVAKADAKK